MAVGPLQGPSSFLLFVSVGLHLRLFTVLPSGQALDPSSQLIRLRREQHAPCSSSRGAARCPTVEPKFDHRLLTQPKLSGHPLGCTNHSNALPLQPWPPVKLDTFPPTAFTCAL